MAFLRNSLFRSRFAVAALVLVGATALVFVGALAGRSVSFADSKGLAVAYVDTTKLFAEYPSMKAMQAQLEKETKQMQADFDKKATGLDNDSKQKLFQEFQGRLEKRKGELVPKAVDQVLAVVRKIAQQQGYSMVLEKQAILYGGKDITADVLKAGGVK